MQAIIAINNLESFEAGFKQHYDLLCLVAFRVTGDGEAAKDIVQDFFIKLWQKREQLQIQGSFQAYAARAVRNMSLDYLESKLSEDRFYANAPFPEIQEDFLEEEESRQVLQSSGESLLQWVAEMPAARRKVFTLYAIDGRSYQQIADELGISINSVKTQMKRSYVWLRSKAESNPQMLVFLLILVKAYEK